MRVAGGTDKPHVLRCVHVMGGCGSKSQPEDPGPAGEEPELQESNSHEAVLSELFELADADGSGSLTPAELKAALGHHSGGSSAFDWLDSGSDRLDAALLPNI